MKTEEMIGWKRTLIKSNLMQFKPSKWRIVEDGKLDMILTIPLTNLFGIQAKQSYGQGLIDMAGYIIKRVREKKEIDIDALVDFFKDMGLPNFAEEFRNFANKQKETV